MLVMNHFGLKVGLVLAVSGAWCHVHGTAKKEHVKHDQKAVFVNVDAHEKAHDAAKKADTAWCPKWIV